ncbi:hypothetical protein ACW4YW_06530 [Methylobacillus pratensis]
MTSPASQPLVSVIILDSQNASFLSQAIDSVRAQGIDDLELIIGDDIQQATGQYLAFLEADGAFEPGTLRARLEYLQTHPETSLVHSPVRLIDMDGNDLGAAIVRPKAIEFDAAVNPVHLSGVMGKAALFRGLALSPDAALGWYRGWLLFAQVLSTGVTSEYVEQGGAQHRVCRAPTLAAELERHEAALKNVLGWIYAPTHPIISTPGFRQPPFAVARRLREFSLFIWCLISGNENICQSMMEDTGFVAFLNTWLVKSVKAEIQLQAARHYHINLTTQVNALPEDSIHTILRDAISLGLQEKSPSIMLAICECLAVHYPQDHKTNTRHNAVRAKVIAHKPQPRPFALITTFRVTGDADDVKNCAETLLANCSEPSIDHVHVLLEGPVTALEDLLQDDQAHALRSYLAQGKLVLAPITSRPYYNSLFDYANSLGNVSAAIVNADMLLPAQAVHDLRDGLTTNHAPIYALTRWNQTSTGEYLQSLQPHPPWAPWSPDGRCHFEKNYLSYDCYVFNTPISTPASLSSVLIGTLGCDTAIVALLRIEGYAVNNPCLSIRTLHKDEKLRDYSDQNGQQHFKNNIEAVAASLLRQYAQHPAYSHSLNNLQSLNKKVTWLGGPGSTKLMPTIFFNLGASPWTTKNTPTPFSTIRIRITNGDLATASEQLARIPEAIKHDLFIIWELSGFGPEGGHIVDLLIKDVRFEALGYPLFGYQRQAMIHQDLASSDERRTIENLCRMLAKLIYQPSSPAH